MESEITVEKALKALKQIKTYCAATNLDELNFTIEVMEKLKESGIKEPLKVDFSKLK